VAVASAGLYASLHLAPDRKPCQHPTTQIFTGRIPFLPPNSQSTAEVCGTYVYMYMEGTVAVALVVFSAASVSALKGQWLKLPTPKSAEIPIDSTAISKYVLT